MMVVRIIRNGCDINGNMKNKIIAYRQIEDETNNNLIECMYLSKEKIKSLGFHGRYNANTHTINTFYSWDEIKQILRKHAQRTGEKVITIYE